MIPGSTVRTVFCSTAAQQRTHTHYQVHCNNHRSCNYSVPASLCSGWCGVLALSPSCPASELQPILLCVARVAVLKVVVWCGWWMCDFSSLIGWCFSKRCCGCRPINNFLVLLSPSQDRTGSIPGIPNVHSIPSCFIPIIVSRYRRTDYWVGGNGKRVM